MCVLGVTAWLHRAPWEGAQGEGRVNQAGDKECQGGGGNPREWLHGEAMGTRAARAPAGMGWSQHQGEEPVGSEAGRAGRGEEGERGAGTHREELYVLGAGGMAAHLPGGRPLAAP